MRYSRRHALTLGSGLLAGFGLAALAPRRLRAQDTVYSGDRYPSDAGEIIVYPVEHASLVMTTPGLVIYVDPVGGADRYADYPAPGLILVTHEHEDHYDAATLAAIATPTTQILTNPAVHDMLPEDLRSRATAIANGESTTVNDMAVDAIPAYNTTPERMQYHPQGRDNGYVLTIGGTRVYIAGDTEDTPEMRALEDIDIAFVPMNLPYTMDAIQAAASVAAFGPGSVYPYHYRGTDLDAFETALTQSSPGTSVRRGNWYTGT